MGTPPLQGLHKTNLRHWHINSEILNNISSIQIRAFRLDPRNKIHFITIMGWCPWPTYVRHRITWKEICMKRDYWLDLFTGLTWDEFRKARSFISGFRESRWKTLQRIAIGYYFLCYLTGVSRFIGILEVTGEPFKKHDRTIWTDDDFPCRLQSRPKATFLEL